MDPNAAQAEINTLTASGEDPDRLADLREALADWIASGGFPPGA